MKQIVSFDKLKLTNNLLDDNGHVGVTIFTFITAQTSGRMRGVNILKLRV